MWRTNDTRHGAFYLFVKNDFIHSETFLFTVLLTRELVVSLHHDKLVMTINIVLNLDKILGE